MAYLVAHDGLLNGGQVFQGREQDMPPLRAAHVVDEVAELLTKGDQDLVLVLDRL